MLNNNIQIIYCLSITIIAINLLCLHTQHYWPSSATSAEDLAKELIALW